MISTTKASSIWMLSLVIFKDIASFKPSRRPHSLANILSFPKAFTKTKDPSSITISNETSTPCQILASFVSSIKIQSAPTVLRTIPLYPIVDNMHPKLLSYHFHGNHCFNNSNFNLMN